MSLLDYFMKSHDLKDGEEFTIGNGSIYKIENDILYYHPIKDISVLFKSQIYINKLNTATIKKLPWKPVNGELYYTINFKCESGVISDSWTDCGLDNMLRKRGLVFRTKEEAEKAFEKLRRVLNNVD